MTPHLTAMKYTYLLAIFLLFPTTAFAKTRELPTTVSFNAHIRPIMSNTCFTCHGPDAEENPSGYRLDTFKAATAVLPSDSDIRGIVPGKPESSEVFLRIMGKGNGDAMPPEDFRHQLADFDKQLFQRWIEQGAQYEQHWSYAPIVRSDVPKLTKHASKVSNPIDAFVLARLESDGIDPSDLADKPAILRRLSLDLIGLPPTPEEIANFIADHSPDAYSRQVERLLNSKHFGERMASSWLDIVRFADTVGFHGDQNQRNSPYRDYVIDAFNKNKPFDQFVTEQIAGDLLDNPTEEQLTATGFLRLNMVTREGGAQPEEYLAKSKADRVRTMGTAFLGSTLACCECHNHKYDPFTINDFYSLGAYFDDLRQWGVYSDYGYTPNKDLKGFNNDYPFPPELRVQSEAAHSEINFLQSERDQRIASVIGRETLNSTPFKEWRAATQEILASNPDGWVQAKLRNVKTESTKAVLMDDASVLFTGKPTKSELLQLETSVASAMTVNSIRLEVLPDNAIEGFVGRASEGRFSLKFSAELERAKAAEPTRANKLPAVSARFVRIELPGTNKILSLAEVQVFVKDDSGKMRNIALSGKATQSTDYKTGPAHLAIDGNTDGHYYNAQSVTHTHPGDDPWWQVDLGSTQTIETIFLWNRTDDPSYQERLRNYHVKLLNENGDLVVSRSPGTPNPSLEIPFSGEEKKPDVHPIELAWSEADRQNPSRYQSGREPLFLDQAWRSGPTPWQLPSDEAKLRHTAIYHFEKPIHLTPDDTLRIKIDSADVGRVRVSLTPLGHSIAGWDAASEVFRKALATPIENLNSNQSAMLLSAYHRSTVPVKQQSAISRQYRDEILRLRSGLLMTLIAQSIPEEQLPVSRVLPRGNWQDKSGELAPPATPHFLPKSETETQRRQTRLDLARWVTSQENPLPSRHFVNRTWKHFFGVGFSSKLDDLGNQGEWPSHPLLLDWLSAEFIESGWNVKHIIRLIVNSYTYRQTAATRSDLVEVDPYNRLLAQQSPRRLEAEAIRDNVMAISGLLCSDFIGGTSVFAYQPDGHYSNLQFPDRRYDATTDSRQYRRGVYMHWQRTFLHPMLVNFDSPSRDECTADRSLSNSPQQALTLLNDPTFSEAAHAMANDLRLKNPNGSFQDLLNAGFLRAVSRKPSEREASSLEGLYTRQLEYFTTNKDEAEKFIRIGNSNQVKSSASVVEIAALAQVCRVILNLHETITRY